MNAAIVRPVNNRGRLINFIIGVTGVVAGGQAVINNPTALRAHMMSLQCSGIGYNLRSTVAVNNAAGTLAAGQITATVVNGQITGLTIVTAAFTQANGTYPLTFTDPVGIGAAGTYTIAANVITLVTLTSGGVVGPIPPDLFFTSFQQSIGGTLFRDINPVDILAIAYAQSKISQYIPRAGELPVFYTEPWRNMNQRNDTTSWDLFGQTTWQIKMGIVSAVTSPSVIGHYEFDGIRNTRKQTGANGTVTKVAFLNPVRQHAFTIPVPAGRFDINYLPADAPIARMWLGETGPGSIYQVEVYQDGNKILEATLDEIMAAYGRYGFILAQGNAAGSLTAGTQVLTQTGTVVAGTYSPTQVVTQQFKTYDAAFIADPDQRLYKALQIAKTNGLILRVYSAAATNLNILMETLPGGYS
jgi:hypothetical protein